MFMPMSRVPSRFKQRGSAMTELFVLGIVLVPMLSVAPLLGKLTDVNQTTVQAARYAVWERSITGADNKSDTVLATEVNNRFYSRPDARIKTGQGALTGASNQNALWTSAGQSGGQPKRLLSNGSSQIFLATNNESVPGKASSLLNSVGGVRRILSVVNSGSNWDLESKGLYSVNLGVNLKSNPFQDNKGTDCKNQASDSSGGCVRRGYAMLVDTWDAGGPADVKNRVKTLVPINGIKPLTEAISALGNIPIFPELKQFDDKIGEVKPDILPPDRYGDK